MSQRSNRLRGKALVAALRRELALVREENLRLLLERERTLGALRDEQRLEQLRRDVAEANEHDDVGQTLAYTAALHDGLLTACRELRVALGDVTRRVADSGHPPVADRRAGGRRRDDHPAVQSDGASTWRAP